MKRRAIRIPELGGARVIILHRPHPTVQALSRQLTAIGLSVIQAWPELGPEALAADYIFFDADMGHDGMFPWDAGQPPIPMIALIGSEAPGRIEWSLKAGAHAQLLKPVGDNGAYSALLIARDTFDAQRALSVEIADLRRRLEDRQTVVRAVTLLAARGKTEVEAYAQLRQLAMAWRISFEDAAARIVASHGAGRDGTGKDGDDRHGRG
ncbi:MAG: transcriptional antiterminator [Rhodobacter sp.]|nr:transcriptional antiterminator [Rhodobacter sp.]